MEKPNLHALGIWYCENFMQKLRLNGACALLGIALFFVQRALGEDGGKEPNAVLEIGASASRNLTDRASNGGPTVAVEFSPIEDWLEIEMGVTPSFGRHSTEWGTDVLLKKPWTLSRTAEVMVGAGPAWVHTNSSGAVRNALAGEAVVDFMFWPFRKHKRFGWYLEPGYEYTFGRGHERSIGMSGGLLIAFPGRY